MAQGIDLPGYFARGEYRICGGPFRQAPKMGVFTVKLAEEIQAPCSYDLPIRDFKTPDPSQLLAAIRATLSALAAGRAVYVGCMGGRGRTGLFLAVMAKLWGYNDPVAYVRAVYFPKAVETPEQEYFVDRITFPVSMKMDVIMLKTQAFFAGKMLTPAI